MRKIRPHLRSHGRDLVGEGEPSCPPLPPPPPALTHIPPLQQAVLLLGQHRRVLHALTQLLQLGLLDGVQQAGGDEHLQRRGGGLRRGGRGRAPVQRKEAIEEGHGGMNTCDVEGRWIGCSNRMRADLGFEKRERQALWEEEAQDRGGEIPPSLTPGTYARCSCAHPRRSPGRTLLRGPPSTDAGTPVQRAVHSQVVSRAMSTLDES